MTKKELVVGQINEPQSLDSIQRSGDTGATEVLQQIYNELLHFDAPSGKIQPQLVESWRATSPTTWEFKLKEGVQFHKNYGEFTADDVEFNVNYTLDKKALRSNRFLFVKGAKATGKYTVAYELERQYAAFFVSTMAGIGGQMVSKKAYQEMGEKDFARNPIATGPWQLESWKPGELVLTRHKNYYGPGLPYLDKITFIPVPDWTVRKAKVQAGEVDFVGQPDYKDLPELQKDANLTVLGVPAGEWDYIAFNLKDPQSPFQKQAVRQAISYAINRNDLVQGVYFGLARPTDSPLPPGWIGHVDGPVVYPYAGDLARAKSLMSDAGMASGFSATCITSNRPGFQRELEIVADQLRQININITIQVVDRATYVTRRDQVNFQMLLEGIGLVSPDPDDALINFQYSKGNNNEGWVSPEVDSLIEQGRALMNDDAGRQKIYERIVQLTLAGAGYIYLTHANSYRIMRKGLTGFGPGIYDQQIFLEKMRWT